MKHLSNEEIAKELCDCYSCKACSKFAEKGAAFALSSTCDRFSELMEAMQRKDKEWAERFKKAFEGLWRASFNVDKRSSVTETTIVFKLTDE